jgi:hypothetical protein
MFDKSSDELYLSRPLGITDLSKADHIPRLSFSGD